MATIGIKRSTWQGLSAANKERARNLAQDRGLRLVDPAVYVIGGVEWFVFDDDRLSRLTEARIVERFPALAGSVMGIDSDWSSAVPKAS